jgi:hypothetical protein
VGGPTRVTADDAPTGGDRCAERERCRSDGTLRPCRSGGSLQRRPRAARQLASSAPTCPTARAPAERRSTFADSEAPALIAALSLDRGAPALLIAGGLVLLGQALAHRYSLARERRKEVANAVDRTVAALVLIDRRLSHFVTQAGIEQTQEVLLPAAELVTDAEVDLRSALFSLRIRLSRNHPLVGFFSAAQELYTQSYFALEPLIVYGHRTALGGSSMLLGLAKDARAEALDAAQEHFLHGPVSSSARRGYRLVRSSRASRRSLSADGHAVWLALSESELVIDEDGWTRADAIQEEIGGELDAVKGAFELVGRGWASTDGSARFRFTLIGARRGDRR